MTPDQLRTRFRELHQGPDLFVIPNPWDVGSARILESQGFQALATTSSGFAYSVGLDDGDVDLDRLVGHVRALTDAVDVPVSVDAERCFAEDASGVADTIDALAAAGAAGCSIEDWNPATGAIDPFDVAAERVAVAVDAARRHGMVLTARAENRLRGVDDIEDTIRRLLAFRDLGAECLYAPGLRDRGVIGRVVDELAAPVNVLAMPGGPSVPDLASIGVRRVSTGGALARAAYGVLVEAGNELIGPGTAAFAAQAMPSAEIAPMIVR